MQSQIKTIEDIPVAYIAKQGTPSAVAGRAFWELEQKVPLHGNRFYGLFDDRKDEYRACVASTDDNQGQTQQLEHGMVSGGAYAFTTLTGSYYSNVRRIRAAFDFLAQRYTRDTSRPSVEFYKRHNEVVVMLPIWESGQKAT